VDAKLRRELHAIARDNRSGAAELTARAVRAVEAWLNRSKTSGPDELLNVARALLKGQRSMAPMLRVANEVALASEGRDPRKTLRRAMRGVRVSLDEAPGRIGQLFAKRLRRNPPAGLVTYSYSSTVLRALVRARPHVSQVICAEGRPMNEGRATARALAKAGIRVEFLSDAALMDAVALGHKPVVLGADAILRLGFMNKVGTPALVELASRAGRPVWILADTLKFWPESPVSARFWKWTVGPSSELWRAPSRKIEVENSYFELTTYRPGLHFLTEIGWLTPTQVRRELNKIRISPKLKELID